VYCTFKEFKRHEIISDAAELSIKNKNAKENLNKYLNQLSISIASIFFNQYDMSGGSWTR